MYIKLFESFEKEDLSFPEILSNLRLLYNDSYPNILDFGGISDDLWHNIMDDYELFNDIKDIDVDSITEEDKNLLIDKYKVVANKYNLSDLPNVDEINDILIPFKDLAIDLSIDHEDLLELTYRLDKTSVNININFLLPGRSKREVKNKHTKDYFDVSDYELIFNEYLSCVGRLKNNYNIKTYIGNTGKLSIEVKR